MYNLPGNVYLVSIFLFFQGFLILMVVFLFIDKFFSTRKQRLESSLVKQEAFNQAQKALDEARMQAQELIKNANAKAAKVITEAQFISTSSEKSIDESIRQLITKQQQELTQAVTTFINDLKSDFSREKVSTLAGLDSILADMKKEAQQQVQAYKEVLVKNSVDAEGLLKSETQQYINEVREKLTSYEKAELEKLKELSMNTLLRISKELFGQTMTISDHETLVFRLLEEAHLKEKLEI